MLIHLKRGVWGGSITAKTEILPFLGHLWILKLSKCYATIMTNQYLSQYYVVLSALCVLFNLPNKSLRRVLLPISLRKRKISSYSFQSYMSWSVTRSGFLNTQFVSWGLTINHQSLMHTVSLLIILCQTYSGE